MSDLKLSIKVLSILNKKKKEGLLLLKMRVNLMNSNKLYEHFTIQLFYYNNYIFHKNDYHQ